MWSQLFKDLFITFITMPGVWILGGVFIVLKMFKFKVGTKKGQL